MKSDHIAMVLIATIKCAAVAAALYWAYCLTKEGKDGWSWGWFILAAIALAPGSIHFD